MKLSSINKTEYTPEDIQKIVYEGIEDSGENTKYGLVFGNSDDLFMKTRVYAAVIAYRTGRIKKVIFSGGNNGVSNVTNDKTPEAIKMKELGLIMGIQEEDIIVEDKSNTSMENVDFSFQLIEEKIDSIAIITNEFHLKRCMAVVKKRFPEIEIIMLHAKDGLTDSDNWYLTEKGKAIAANDVRLLLKHSKEERIYDVDIPNFTNGVKTFGTNRKLTK